MRGKGGGFGVLVLLIVVLVVMLLAARAWKAVAPTAVEATNPSLSEGVDDRGQTEAGREVRSGNLPGLEEMRQRTDAHASEVEEAQKTID
jgi:hypothetical protein